jgi:hypothetical protein
LAAVADTLGYGQTLRAAAVAIEAARAGNWAHTNGTQETPMSNLPISHAQQVAAFLEKQHVARGRIAFVLDATASRERAWDSASQLTSEMLVEAAKLGGLEMQVIYFRGPIEVGASRWSGDARELQSFMARIRCEGGETKYARAFARVRQEHQQQPINAVVVIGDMLEEAPGTLYDGIAGLGVPFFCFLEGQDPDLRAAFQELARLSKGAYCAFDAGAIAQLRELLRAVAAFAVGGVAALADLRTDGARRLLEQMKK